MNRVLCLDKEAHTAVIEGGALGPDLEEQLYKEGFSLGHDPDSFEYSTLGTCPFGAPYLLTSYFITSIIIDIYSASQLI